MLLELKDIRKSYGRGDYRVEVLRGISLGVGKGEFCVLLGPSGSGKSTLLNIIGGIDTADSGEILILLYPQDPGGGGPARREYQRIRGQKGQRLCKGPDPAGRGLDLFRLCG